MRQTCRKLLLAAAAVISVFVIVQPVLAQSSGVGCDGNTRLLWKGADQSISLWKLDANLNFLADAGFGPYAGWSPEGITTACNNNTYVLWLGLTVNGLGINGGVDNSNVALANQQVNIGAFNGTALIQQLDANLKFVTQQTYTQTGWVPESLSADPSNSTLRIIWKATTTSGATVAISYLHPDLSVVKTVTYGPAPGFE